jgi:hypothetical protein
MADRPPDHTLEFLLAFDGRIHHLEAGYRIKFEIRTVEATKLRQCPWRAGAGRTLQEATPGKRPLASHGT